MCSHCYIHVSTPMYMCFHFYAHCYVHVHTVMYIWYHCYVHLSPLLCTCVYTAMYACTLLCTYLHCCVHALLPSQNTSMRDPSADPLTEVEPFLANSSAAGRCRCLLTCTDQSVQVAQPPAQSLSDLAELSWQGLPHHHSCLQGPQPGQPHKQMSGLSARQIQWVLSS